PACDASDRVRSEQLRVNDTDGRVLAQQLHQRSEREWKTTQSPEAEAPQRHCEPPALRRRAVLRKDRPRPMHERRPEVFEIIKITLLRPAHAEAVDQMEDDRSSGHAFSAGPGVQARAAGNRRSFPRRLWTHR